ncbi:hypothetical protein [Poseidonocella sp. HB161398]|uniref:hypothetical protein n=1 Tax=Poseidonocella sp. HB161398 TaxID=2320855 RepID=UPI0011092EC8|nr:hypothetical protein [Poseidonocella sp. HB161398]
MLAEAVRDPSVEVDVRAHAFVALLGNGVFDELKVFRQGGDHAQVQTLIVQPFLELGLNGPELVSHHAAHFVMPQLRQPFVAPDQPPVARKIPGEVASSMRTASA